MLVDICQGSFGYPIYINALHELSSTRLTGDVDAAPLEQNLCLEHQHYAIKTSTETEGGSFFSPSQAHDASLQSRL